MSELIKQLKEKQELIKHSQSIKRNQSIKTQQYHTNY